MPLRLANRLNSLLFSMRWPAAPIGYPRRTGRDLASEISAAYSDILKPYELDAEKFWEFKKCCGYAESYSGYMGADLLNQKLLEHFVSIELLDIGREGAVIDVGSAVSPFAEYIEKKVGCKSYSLDLAYPAGVHGNKIGCSADNIPLEAESVSAMTLHCTIDHFQGDRDSRFVREAARILRPGGKVCILPVYFAGDPTNICDPEDFAFRAEFDPMADVRKVRGYNNSFGRFYSTETFRRRLIEASPELSPRLYSIEGDQPLVPNNYLHYALVLEKKR